MSAEGAFMRWIPGRRTWVAFGGLTALAAVLFGAACSARLEEEKDKAEPAASPAGRDAYCRQPRWSSRPWKISCSRFTKRCFKVAGCAVTVSAISVFVSVFRSGAGAAPAAMFVISF